MVHPPTHLVFVEVRYRNTSQYGGALASVTREKQRCIKRTAAAFLQQQRQFRNLASRFDVVALSAGAQHDRDIQWIRNAFY